MIFGTGLDIIEIERIKNSIEKYSPKFEQRVFTSSEISYCQTKGNPAKHFAARFAVKEAVSKCLGTGITCLLYTSPSPRDLSTSRMPSSA